MLPQNSVKPSVPVREYVCKNQTERNTSVICNNFLK
jgi:hypothetical protein